ncbi:hypothetical protein CL631_01065 [bacterium]|jgi:hypothetical protein|nr:hypothetical protein [bacterium]MDP6659819.1 hypothetical protein [Candidatus Paceibacterota bacterium]|tara:strand:- start:51040 stop:52248 length:1209 start_codon:yes stop_codon:yes gene_type:complete
MNVNIIHKYIVAGIVILVVLVGLGFFYINNVNSGYIAIADEIIETCKNEGYRPACYDVEIPKVMDRGLSMEEAFEVTKVVQDKDDAYLYCHVLGHYLAIKETAKDPSRWKEVVSRAPGGICSNGAIHGAFQERFRVESLPDAEIEELKLELEGVCEKRENWNPTPLEGATCTHAFGHLTMYVTDANIDKSLILCDEISNNTDGRDLRQLCYDGVFMQLYQPLEPDDFALIEGQEIETKSEAIAFCDQFDGEIRGACISESWPLWREDLQSNPQETVDFCSRLKNDPKEEKRCYTAIFYVLTALSNLDEEWVSNYCTGIEASRQPQCFANAASRMIETDWRNIDRAIALCKVADGFGVSDECYDELLLYSSYNFVIGSEEFDQLCDSLPDPWRGQCFARSIDI